MITINIEKELIGAQHNFKLAVSKTVDKGLCIGVFGNSGSGKTTLLRSLSGLEKEFKGLIKVEDTVWVDTIKNKYLPVKDREIGFVTQESVLFPNMNIREQLTFSKGKHTNQELLEEVVAIFEIENLLSMYPNFLSGGQKQRICLARAILQEPKLLLLDEPFSALDYGIRKQLIALTRKIIKRFSLTTFFVSHHPLEIKDLANKVWVLKNGIIVDEGETGEVMNRYM